MESEGILRCHGGCETKVVWTSVLASKKKLDSKAEYPLSVNFFKSEGFLDKAVNSFRDQIRPRLTQFSFEAKFDLAISSSHLLGRPAFFRLKGNLLNEVSGLIYVWTAPCGCQYRVAPVP